MLPAKAIWGIFSENIAPDLAKKLTSGLHTKPAPGRSYELDLVLTDHGLLEGCRRWRAVHRALVTATRLIFVIVLLRSRLFHRIVKLWSRHSKSGDLLTVLRQLQRWGFSKPST